MAAQGLRIQNVVFYRAGIGQVQTHALVLELGPQDTRRVQQLQPTVDRHPLLAAGNAGAVLCLGGLAARHLIDEGGLAHVGDAQDHHPDHPARHALFGIGLQLVRQQFPDGSGKLRRSLAAPGVGFQDGIALGPEIRRPLLRGFRVCLVHAVQHHKTGLPRRQLVHVRVSAGHRDAGVQNFAHRVHILDLVGDHPPGLGHMTGIPLNIHTNPPLRRDAQHM